MKKPRRCITGGAFFLSVRLRLTASLFDFLRAALETIRKVPNALSTAYKVVQQANQKQSTESFTRCSRVLIGHKPAQVARGFALSFIWTRERSAPVLKPRINVQTKRTGSKVEVSRSTTPSACARRSMTPSGRASLSLSSIWVGSWRAMGSLG